ncbi:cation transport protein-domain-containing protein [Chiua virens]|nr:cation transport protein-domain-containing protein [Chiua virens]
MSDPSASPGLWTTLRRNLNFFRIHLLFFTFAPLIFSAILYASNGRYPISYIDALFNSVSAITVCGLATVNMSQLTPWQQVLLFIQMCVGSPVVVSWFMVYIRRNFFAKKFEYIVQAEAARRARSSKTQPQPSSSELATASGRPRFGWPVTSLLRRRTRLSPIPEFEEGSSTPKAKEMPKKVRTDMIRRMDAPPKRVDPNGWITEGLTVPLKRLSLKIGSDGGQEKGKQQPSSPNRIEHSMESPRSPGPLAKDTFVQGEDTQVQSHAPGGNQPPSIGFSSLDQTNPQHISPSATGMPRNTTVEFAPTVTRHYVPLATVANRRSGVSRDAPTDERLARQISRDSSYSRRHPSIGGLSQTSLTRVPSQHTFQSIVIIDHVDHEPEQTSQTGFGGFPMPHKLLGILFRRWFPGAARRLRRTVTIPTTQALSGGELGRTASISGGTGGTIGNMPEGSKPVPYISFDATVGRNSSFQMLTNEQLEELGGVEYRGLNALLWLVALYHIGSQLVAFVVIAPYMTMPKWASNFVPPAQIRPVATPWFSLFQVVSSYTNTGFSLVDQSMIPFQTAYPMIFFMIFLILAGNTSFARRSWIISKSIPTNSRLYETLRFLLDHPRRCFVYLFPSHQTWFLFLIVSLLNFVDFFCFMVLDIGNPEIASIPLGTRFAAGLLQAANVRASGFSVVPLSALAPAVKYVSCTCNTALSVRATNVYEEKSLGIYYHEDQFPAAEQAFKTEGSRMSMWGHYLAMHARYQLSFGASLFFFGPVFTVMRLTDMWWLALALFLVCIIERDNLINPEIQSWFNIFTILFEIVSAYGSVGLSLGIPTQNYSLSGAFRPLSKLVLCLVMLRGRHRGLPVAIDRAVVLPYEFERMQDSPDSPSGVDDKQYSFGAFSRPVGESIKNEPTTAGRERVGTEKAIPVAVINTSSCYCKYMLPTLKPGIFPPPRPLNREHAGGVDADASIRQTDTDAALARLSAVKKGYIQDPFITHLVPRSQFQPTRPPLINIGTYVRSTSIDTLVDQWLALCEQQNAICQIVSLGAGSDTRFWRISTGPRAHVLKSYFELDFSDVTTKKAMAIRKSKVLSTVLGSPEDITIASGGTALHSNKYHLLPCDLRHPPPASIAPLLEGLLSPSHPTLLLFECVLVYMSPESSSALIDWFVNYFAAAPPESGRVLGAVVYEMFGLQDAFGRVMVNNLQVCTSLFFVRPLPSIAGFKSRNVTLPGAAPYPTVESLPERFTRHGFTFAQALTLSEMRAKYMSQSELQRISHLELLDEIEELNLVLQHYAITWSVKTFALAEESGWGQWSLTTSRPAPPDHDDE